MPGPFRAGFTLPGRGSINWKFLRAIVFPFVVVSVPVGILLVLEFRSLDRFEAASAEILRRSAVQAAEELSDRIVEGLPRHHGRTGEPADGDSAAALDAPDLDGSGGGPLMATPDPSGGTRPAAATAVPRRRPEPSWHPPAGAHAIPASGAAANDYYGRADARPTGPSAERSADGSPVLVVSARELADDYLPTLVAGMRSQRRNLLAGPPLELSVLDDRGREIYRTGSSLGQEHVHEVEFPFLASRREDLAAIGSPGGPTWRVRAGYPGTTVADLARARTNHQRQLLFFVAFVAAAGIVLTSRAMARELEVQKMRSDFVSGVSHDLKTPLASIQVFAETLASSRARSEEKVEEYARMIGLEAAKLGRLIHDMLDSNKIEAGIRRYPVEEIDLAAIVRQAVAGFELQLEEAGFTTELAVPEGELPFLGNRDGLVQALDNLIGNAIKFRDEHSDDPDHHLTVRLRKEDDNAVIEVEDRGLGIPPAERRRVFERFYRVLQEPDTDAAGTGLGLAIVKHVAESHGGRVTVEGNRFGGSTFRIELPLWFSGSDAS